MHAVLILLIRGAQVDINRINQIVHEAFLHYTYQEDPAGRDTWVSHADDVYDGKRWVGDCDDITSTCLDLLSRSGCSSDALWRGMVRTRNATDWSRPDHMVGYVRDDSGHLWVVGDTYNPHPYPISIMEHTQIKNSPCSGVIWYNSALK